MYQRLKQTLVPGLCSVAKCGSASTIILAQGGHRYDRDEEIEFCGPHWSKQCLLETEADQADYEKRKKKRVFKPTLGAKTGRTRADRPNIHNKPKGLQLKRRRR